jgi:bifunctional NMN adenylyltransferase/nudix hydrolase
MAYEYAIVIGRFQPFHLAHKQLLDKAYEIASRVIIILGSHQAAQTSKNPWTSQERIDMIVSGLSDDQNSRTTFLPVRDYLYNENAWLSEIQQKVKTVTSNSKSIVLIGHIKDDSSSYLNTFPQWEFAETTTRMDLSATDIRHTLFTSENMDSLKKLPEKVLSYLLTWMETPAYLRLKEEYKYLQDYKACWAVAPYPVTFVTADAVVIKSGHVLVVKRGGNPGKGLVALPGGFVNQNESLDAACLRELKEETKIKVSTDKLIAARQANHVFDHPQRSLRGRTITHAYLFDLGKEGDLPGVKGSDDAELAFWMPIGDVYSNEATFFEDHRDIILYFFGR